MTKKHYHDTDLSTFDKVTFRFHVQDFQIYSVTIAENVLMREIQNKQEDEKIVWDALEKCGLADKIRTLPNQIHTILTNEFDTDGVLFSGGELQKLALARVLAKTMISLFWMNLQVQWILCRKVISSVE